MAKANNEFYLVIAPIASKINLLFCRQQKIISSSKAKIKQHDKLHAEVCTLLVENLYEPLMIVREMLHVARKCTSFLCDL